MLPFSLLMFAVAIVFLVLGLLIRNGKTELIHVCHQTAVAIVYLFLGCSPHNGKTELIHDFQQTGLKDKAAYGKAFSKAVFILAISLAISGFVALFGKTIPIKVASIGILVIGITVSFILVLKIQKKFNNEVF